MRSGPQNDSGFSRGLLSFSRSVRVLVLRGSLEGTPLLHKGVCEEGGFKIVRPRPRAEEFRFGLGRRRSLTIPSLLKSLKIVSKGGRGYLPFLTMTDHLLDSPITLGLVVEVPGFVGSLVLQGRSQQFFKLFPTLVTFGGCGVCSLCPLSLGRSG